MAGILSGIWKGLFGSSQDDLNEKATEESIFQMQHPFARTMQDAQQYGINPITALGATPSASTYSGSSASSSPADALGLLAPIMQSIVSKKNNDSLVDAQLQMNENNNATAERIADADRKSKEGMHQQEQELARRKVALDEALAKHKITQEQKELINSTSLTMTQIEQIYAQIHSREKELEQSDEKNKETKRHNIVSEVLQGFGIVGNFAGRIGQAIMSLF